MLRNPPKKGAVRREKKSRDQRTKKKGPSRGEEIWEGETEQGGTSENNQIKPSTYQGNEGCPREKSPLVKKTYQKEQHQEQRKREKDPILSERKVLVLPRGTETT